MVVPLFFGTHVGVEGRAPPEERGRWSMNNRTNGWTQIISVWVGLEPETYVSFLPQIQGLKNRNKSTDFIYYFIKDGVVFVVPPSRTTLMEFVRPVPLPKTLTHLPRGLLHPLWSDNPDVGRKTQRRVNLSFPPWRNVSTGYGLNHCLCERGWSFCVA